MTHPESVEGAENLFVGRSERGEESAFEPAARG
jgi:hypothetical protein